MRPSGRGSANWKLRRHRRRTKEADAKGRVSVPRIFLKAYCPHLLGATPPFSIVPFRRN
jgi:hypothetical protein